MYNHTIDKDRAEKYLRLFSQMILCVKDSETKKVTKYVLKNFKDELVMLETLSDVYGIFVDGCLVNFYIISDELFKFHNMLTYKVESDKCVHELYTLENNMYISQDDYFDEFIDIHSYLCTYGDSTFLYSGSSIGILVEDYILNALVLLKSWTPDENIGYFREVLDNNYSLVETFGYPKIGGIKNTMELTRLKLAELADKSSFYFIDDKNQLRLFESMNDIKGCEYVDCYFDDRDYYRVHKDAIFQAFNTPIYISKDGVVYLMFRTAGHEVKTISYRLKDINEFKSFMTKYKMLGERDYEVFQ
jgi:hypothetical protein